MIRNITGMWYGKSSSTSEFDFNLSLVRAIPDFAFDLETKVSNVGNISLVVNDPRDDVF